MFVGLLSVCTVESFSASLTFNYKETIKYVSLNNQPCQATPKLVDKNSDETLFYSLIVSANKCGESCNNFNDLYLRACVPNKSI